MCTSRAQGQRCWSSRSFAHRAILSVFIIWSSVNIPHHLFVRRNVNTRGNISSQFGLYINYFSNPVLYGIVPIVILFYFGQRKMKNISSIRQGRMLLFQITLSVFTSVPLITFSISFGVTSTMSKDTNHQAIEYMISQRVRLVNNLNYTSAFYMNLITMPEVRYIIKKIIICRHHIVTPNTINITERIKQHTRKGIDTR